MEDKSAAQELISLIQSLSKTEKRYFRLYANQRLQKGEKVYLQLYDHLVAQGSWSEDGIRIAFEGKGFLKQLVVARTRLQDLLLAALSSYDAGQTLQSDFSQRLDEIGLLYRRQQFGMCRRLVHAALRKAAALDLPVQMIALLEYAMRLERQKPGPTLSERLGPLHDQAEHAAAQLATEVALRRIYDKISSLMPQHAGKYPDHLAEADALMGSAVLDIPLAALSFDAKLLHVYVHMFHARIHADHRAFTLHNQRIVEIWEASPERIRYQEENFFGILVAYAESTWLSQMTALRPPLIAKLKRLMQRSKRIQRHHVARILLLDLSQMIVENAWSLADALVPKIQDCLGQFGAHVPAIVRLGLVANVVTVQFYLEKWTVTLQWASVLEREAGGQAAKQWVDLIQIARAIAWYELGEHDVLEKSLRRYRKSNPEDVVFGYFEQLLGATTAAQELEVFQGLRVAVDAASAVEASTHLALVQAWTVAKRLGISLQAAEIWRQEHNP